MKANELRIGNLVFENDLGACTVESIFSKKIEVSVPNGKTNGTINKRWFIMDLYNFKPIPLTEDLIKRLCYLYVDIEEWGNVISNEHESFNRYVFYNVLDGTSNLEIHVIHSNYGGVSNLEFCISIDENERQGFLEIEYLHQLQNGVYFLTNKELTIK